ncbi:Uu.00g063200.m01.CDS01 [Anthostomella pinea]|uniref:Uu.00g063200.m01.CDS01 n=1 Tax=Anthostomella pinea TaxID=933095 RepID=A0AAI8VU57_9PEZI|nr:Uu.00g063200.m01.CDS01 [Anthostomella pinea]
MSTPEELLQKYGGEIVPRGFNAGFVVLSYIVSFTGAASTLELINRRTSLKGVANHMILFSAAVTMGGIAIWSMHFIGNRAVVLANDEVELQIAYSSGFTAFSFFLPILVLLAAFLATGTNNNVSWWRVCGGGSLAGAAICGMHYLGNASINNYTCGYDLPNVIGSALIAIVASIVALSTFFVFRASWSHSWWKRGLSAVVLAGAVSGMHWCAATGTNYRLVKLNESNQLSRNTIVVVVICLSVAAAFIVAGAAIIATRARIRSASQAQQVVLAAAVFDGAGRILVNPDGLLPSEKITDSYVEKTASDTFSIANPLFQWMFQASRDWNVVGPMISGIVNHVANLPKSDRERRMRLISDDGLLIENYDVIFRELFCLAAANLADKLKEQLVHVGILWDEILPTGANGPYRRRQTDGSESLEKLRREDLGEKGEGWAVRDEGYGRGSLMLLVRRLEHVHDVEKLEAAGFRFAYIHQVCDIIGSSMQIKTSDFGGKLATMSTYADQNTMMEPGVHVGFFGVQARVGRLGFDVLVKHGMRNLLPTMPMPFDRLEPWYIDLIRQYDRTSVTDLLRSLNALKRTSPREMLFASQLSETIEALRVWVDEPIFDEAVLTSKIVQLPCRPRPGSDSAKTCTMITLRLMIPIHATIKNPKCEFIPLSVLKVHQMVYKDSPQHLAFSRYVHRELSSPNAAPTDISKDTCHQDSRVFRAKARLSSLARSLHWAGQRSSVNFPVDAEGNPIPIRLGGKKLSGGSVNDSGSTTKLWKGKGSDDKISYCEVLPDKSIGSGPEAQTASSFGGILVSQEIKVDVRQAEEEVDGKPGRGTRQTHCRGPSVAPQQQVSQTMRTPSTGHVTHIRAAGAGLEYELDLMRKGVRAGQTLGSTVVESEDANETMTFVDELFAACVDAR